MDPRGSIFEMTDAGLDNIVLATREKWKVNPEIYPEGPGSLALVEDTAATQEVLGLTIDGRLGPKTKAGIKQLVREGGAVEAGAYGPPTWAQHWAVAISFTDPLVVVDNGGGSGGRDVIVEIDDPGLILPPIEPAQPAKKSGGNGLLWGIAALVGLGLAFG